jgi:catechol 2,3-dioxygenase
MSRRHLISQLAHVEVLSPKPEETVRFLHDVLGLESSGQVGQSAFLRGWGDLFHHSIKVTEAPAAGLGHIGWRAGGPDELRLAAQALADGGHGEGWTEGDTGHGPAYRFRNPEGHVNEVFWDVDWFAPSDEQRSPLPNRTQKFQPRGAAARRIDHVTVFCADVAANRAFYCDVLGWKHMESTHLDANDREVAAFASTGPMAHDIGLIADRSGGRARLNHFAYWLDTREDVLRAADVMRDAGAFIENGPARHGIGEAFFLYVREPGGNRIELFSGGYQVFAPDWGPVRWKASQRGDSYWLGHFNETLNQYGTPDVQVPAQEVVAVAE